MKFVITGHIDHGKSTLIGRLLLDTGSFSKEKLAEIKKISREFSRDTELAFVVDQLHEERSRNMTIDTAQIFFPWRGRQYTIIDTPGHLEFIKNMLTGASHAEAAILLVDSAEGIREQTSRHLFLLKMLGIKKIIVAVNKMDLVGYQSEVFGKIVKELQGFLKTLGLTGNTFIPISARSGDNVLRRSTKMPWYRGPVLLRGLEKIASQKIAPKSGLRLPVQDVYQINGQSVIVGQLVTGTVRPGDNIIIYPSMEKAVVKEIKTSGRQKPTGFFPGENVGIIFDRDIPVKRGQVIVTRESLPARITGFRASLFWLGQSALDTGRPVTIRCATQEFLAVPEIIETRLNSSSLEKIEENARSLKTNEAGVVIFRTSEPVLVEKFPDIEALGRIIIEENHILEGAGTVIEPFNSISS